MIKRNFNLGQSGRVWPIGAEWIAILFSAVMIVDFLLFRRVPGFGGDQIGLHILFQDGNYGPLRLPDFVFKKVIFFLSFGQPDFAVLLTVVGPFLINAAFGVLAINLISDRYVLSPRQCFLIKVLVIFEPLTFSLLLSGHVFFLTNLPIYLAARSQAKGLGTFILSTVIVGYINPYLLLGYISAIAYFEYGAMRPVYDKAVVRFLLLILVLGVLKLIAEVVEPKALATYVGLNQDNRLIPSGVFPLNFLLPDTSSILGLSTIDLKNSLFTYLNVPEANYSLLTLIFVSFFVGRRSWKSLLLLMAFILLFCLPPKTSAFGGVVFPSHLLNVTLPELRILSRFFSSFYLIGAIHLVRLTNLDFKKKFTTLSFILGLVLTLPLAYPKFFLDTKNIVLCENFEGVNWLPRNSPWSQYYSKFFAREVKVSTTLGKGRVLLYCAK